jgi:adenylate cyclase, class 2
MSSQNFNQEVEVRFLEIDKEAFAGMLTRLGAEDLGEELLREIIFADKDLIWVGESKLVRLRQVGGKVLLAYKHHQEASPEGVIEVELEVGDFNQAKLFLEMVGLVSVRVQEKYRHTFKLDGATFDIDTWPKIPTYVEIEGDSEKQLKVIAKKVGLDWRDVVFEDAAKVINNVYGIPIKKLKLFTFSKIE